MALGSYVLLLMLASTPQLLNGMPGKYPKLRIINGSNAAVGEFPYMAAIYYKGYFTCGGTILSEEWILTAAHCAFQRDPLQFYVRTGTNDLLDPNANKTYVNQVIIHESYQYSENQVNDIALFRLSVALEFGALTQQVSLSQVSTDPGDNAKVVVIGWGVNKYGGNPVQYLQKATIEVFSNDACDAVYGPYGVDILSTNMCAGTMNGGIGQCTGDSGGPVLVESSKSYQVGIISFSAKPCGIKGFPGVNTRVSQYLAWIQKQTGL